MHLGARCSKASSSISRMVASMPGYLVAVDAAVDEHGDLEVAELVDQLLSRGSGSRSIAWRMAWYWPRRPMRLRVGDGDQEQVAAAGGLPDDLHPDAVAGHLDLTEPRRDLGVEDASRTDETGLRRPPESRPTSCPPWLVRRPGHAGERQQQHDRRQKQEDQRSAARQGASHLGNLHVVDGVGSALAAITPSPLPDQGRAVPLAGSSRAWSPSLPPSRARPALTTLPAGPVSPDDGAVGEV